MNSEYDAGLLSTTKSVEYSSKELEYIYRWNRMGRKGQRCKLLTRSKRMNSCLLEFEDGFKAVTSLNAIRKVVKNAAQTQMWEDL